jgi:hypothetical protein
VPLVSGVGSVEIDLASYFGLSLSQVKFNGIILLSAFSRSDGMDD